jgi:hypothetical protein
MGTMKKVTGLLKSREKQKRYPKKSRKESAAPIPALCGKGKLEPQPQGKSGKPGNNSPATG